MMKRQETAKRSVILPGSILCKAISLQFLECRQYTQAADLITDVSYPLACSSVVGTEDHYFSRMFQLHQLSQYKRFLLTHTAAVWNSSIACGQCGQKLLLICILWQVNQWLIISGEERIACGFRKCIAACFKHVIIQLRRTASEQLIYFIQNSTVRKQLNSPFCNLLFDSWNRIWGEPVGLQFANDLFMAEEIVPIKLHDQISEGLAIPVLR